MKATAEDIALIIFFSALITLIAGILFWTLWGTIQLFYRKKFIFKSKMNDRLQEYTKQYMLKFSKATKNFLIKLEDMFKDEIKENPGREITIPIKFIDEKYLPGICSYKTAEYHGSNIWIECGTKYKKEFLEMLERQGLFVEVIIDDIGTSYNVVIFKPEI